MNITRIPTDEETQAETERRDLAHQFETRFGRRNPDAIALAMLKAGVDDQHIAEYCLIYDAAKENLLRRENDRELEEAERSIRWREVHRSQAEYQQWAAKKYDEDTARELRRHT